MKLRPKITLLDHFEKLTDPRVERTKAHKLIDIGLCRNRSIVSNSIGGIGIAAGGAAIGVGMIGLATVGTIAGLAVYGLGKALD